MTPARPRSIGRGADDPGEPVPETAAEARPIASWYTPGYSDGLGDRLLMNDTSGEPSLEMLRFHKRFGLRAPFEHALRERVDELADFSHPLVGHVRAIESLGPGEGLALISDYVDGRRLAEVLPQARGAAFALELVRQLAPPLAALQRHGAGIAHGALTPERIIVGPEGRLVIVEHVLGHALEALELPVSWLRSQLGVAVPGDRVVLDQRNDVIQLALVAVSLLHGRRIEPIEYPATIGAVLAEFEWDRYQSAAPLRVWLERALQIGEDGFASAEDAEYALADLPERLQTRSGRTTTRNARPDRGQSAGAQAELAHEPSAPTPAPDASAPAPSSTAPQAPGPSAPPPASAAASAAASPAAPMPPVAAAPTVVMPLPVDPTPIGVPPGVARSDDMPAGASTRQASPTSPPATSTSRTPTDDGSSPSSARPAAAPSDGDSRYVLYAVPSARRFVPDPPRSATTSEPARSLVEPTSRPAVAPFEAARVPAPVEPPRPALAEPPPAAPSAETMQSTLVRPGVAARFSEDPPQYMVELFNPAAVATPSGSRERLPDTAELVRRRLAAAAGEPERRRRLSTPAKWALAALAGVAVGEAVFIAGVFYTNEPLGWQLLGRRGPAASGPAVAGASVTGAPDGSASGSDGAAAVTPTPGRTQIEIRSDPPGARVTLAGRDRGLTPLTIPVEPGSHTVVLSSGSRSFRRTVNVASGSTATVTGSFVPAPSAGWVTVQSPIELQVFEGGSLLGLTSASRLRLPVGRHALDVGNPALGFSTRVTVTVAPGRTTTATVTVPRGSLSVNALPWADVWIDGRPLGPTPHANLDVALGSHEVVWRHPQLGERRQTVLVTAREPLRLMIDLSRR